MPSNITKISDYKGETWLVDGFEDEDQFKYFAFETEKKILRGDGRNDFGLLGDEVYNNLITDLDTNNNPQNAPYINLVDGVNYTQSNGRDTIFIGLRKMLTYFVYAEYLKSNRIKQSIIGSVKITSKNAENALTRNINHEAHKRWNQGVSLFNNEVYDYILFYQSDFINWEFTQQSEYLTKGII